VFKGHVLVATREHVTALPELPDSLLGPVFSTVRHLAQVMPKAYDCQGTFVATNSVVSQSVPHLHIHVVPRTKGDGLRGFFWPRTRYASEAEAANYAQRLRDAL
jgi:histidine triad (HIT) family protein